MKKLNFAVFGLGYVGMSMLSLLSKHHSITGYDKNKTLIESLKKGKLHFSDSILEKALIKNKKNIKYKNLNSPLIKYDYVIVCTPTDFNESTGEFNTSSVISVIEKIKKFNKEISIIIKSTVPIGFTEEINNYFKCSNIIFSPEFLREGSALQDNLEPSRIVIGSQSAEAKQFVNALKVSASKKNIRTIFASSTEAESIKLFSNSFLAMRVAFFNEVDSFALKNNLNSKYIIDGISSDNRIGNKYNNPSFGYGGYCLPKDSKQVLASFKNKVPQKIMKSIVESNSTRLDFIYKDILRLQPKVIGIYKISMKKNSDNFRDSSVIKLLELLKKSNIKIYIYDTNISSKTFKGVDVENNFNKFVAKVDLIIANRVSDELKNIRKSIYTRDIYNNN